MTIEVSSDSLVRNLYVMEEQPGLAEIYGNIDPAIWVYKKRNDWSGSFAKGSIVDTFHID